MSSNPDPNSVNGRDGKEMKEGDAGEMAEAMGYGGVVNMTYRAYDYVCDLFASSSSRYRGS